MTEVTHLLEAANQGDPQAAAQLLPLVYNELRKLAAAKLAGEKPGQTLDATALVHEAYLRLIPDAKPQAAWENRRHFFGAAAEAMRRILVENARRKKALKRGGGAEREPVDLEQVAEPQKDEELLALDEALNALAEKDSIKAELVKLRYFAGLSADEAAACLGISPSTGDRYWNYARAWLKRTMMGGD